VESQGERFMLMPCGTMNSSLRISPGCGTGVVNVQPRGSIDGHDLFPYFRIAIRVG
jgi:hypothetical protein